MLLNGLLKMLPIYKKSKMTKKPKSKKEDTRTGKLNIGELRKNNGFMPISIPTDVAASGRKVHGSKVATEDIKWLRRKGPHWQDNFGATTELRSMVHLTSFQWALRKNYCSPFTFKKARVAGKSKSFLTSFRRELA